MTRNLLFSAVVPACIAFQLAALPIPASGQEVFGGVGGVTRDSASKQPVAQVRITAHNVNKGTDRTAISGPDGTFTIARLEPGQYQVAAARDGFIRIDGRRGSGRAGDLPGRFPACGRLPAGFGSKGLSRGSSRDRVGGRGGACGSEEADRRARGGAAGALGAGGNRLGVRPGSRGAGGRPRRHAAGSSASAGAAAPARAGHSGSPAGPRLHSRGGQLHSVRLRRLYLAQRHPAQQRHGAGYEVLHPGSPIRHSLHGGLQSADGPHHGRVDRVVPRTANSRWSRSASAATSTGKTSAAGS